VLGHPFPLPPVAAGGSPSEQPLLVHQLQRQPVELRLQDVPHLDPGAEAFPYPLVEPAQRRLRVVRFERQHRRRVLNRGKALDRGAAHPLGGRIAAPQLRMRLFERHQLAKPDVVLVVRHFRPVQHIVKMVSTANQSRERLGALAGCVGSGLPAGFRAHGAPSFRRAKLYRRAATAPPSRRVGRTSLPTGGAAALTPGEAAATALTAPATGVPAPRTGVPAPTTGALAQRSGVLGCITSALAQRSGVLVRATSALAQRSGVLVRITSALAQRSGGLGRTTSAPAQRTGVLVRTTSASARRTGVTVRLSGAVARRTAVRGRLIGELARCAGVRHRATGVPGRRSGVFLRNTTLGFPIEMARWRTVSNGIRRGRLRISRITVSPSMRPPPSSVTS